MNYKKNIEYEELKKDFEKCKIRYAHFKNMAKEKDMNYIHIGKNVEEHMCLKVKDYNMKKWKTNIL